MVRFVSEEISLVSVLECGAVRRSVRGQAQRCPAGEVDGPDQGGGHGGRSGPISEIFRRSTPLNWVKDCMREKREVRWRMTSGV